MLDKEIDYIIENVTKVIWNNNQYDIDIWFEVKGSKTDVEAIYDVDCAYLRSELRKCVGRTYIVNLDAVLKMIIIFSILLITIETTMRGSYIKEYMEKNYVLQKIKTN